MTRRRPPHARPLTALVAGVGLALSAACSSGADPNDVNATATPFSESSAATTATAAGEPITSPSPGAVTSSDKTFTFVVPNGWNLSTQPKALVYLSSATVAHDVAPTIVVTRSGVTPAPALDDTLRLATMQARQAGQTVAAAPDRSVGGENAVSFTATSKEKNVQLKRTYVMVAHAKAMYFVTLTGAQADASRDETTLNALLSSWTWTKQGDAGSTANGTSPAAIPTTTSSATSPASSGSADSSSSASSSSSGSAPSGSTSPGPSPARSTSPRTASSPSRTSAAH